MASLSTDPFGGFSPTGGVIPPVCETPAGKPRVCPTVQSTGFGPFLAGNGPHSRKKGTGGAFMSGTAFITGSSRGIGRGGDLLLPGGVRLCHRPGPHRRREAFCNGKAPSACPRGHPTFSPLYASQVVIKIETKHMGRALKSQQKRVGEVSIRARLYGEHKKPLCREISSFKRSGAALTVPSCYSQQMR